MLLSSSLLFHASPSAGEKSVFSTSGVAGCIIICLLVSLQSIYRVCLFRCLGLKDSCLLGKAGASLGITRGIYILELLEF